MLAISEHFIDELNARLDVADVVSAYVPLTRKGANLWGLCPFHSEKTPSFSVSPDKQIFHCFGCGKGGSAIRFVQEMEHLTFPEAVRTLAAKAGLNLPDEGAERTAWRARQTRLLALLKDAARFYYDYLGGDGGSAVAAYLQKRKISPQYARRFGLGAAPDAWDMLLRSMTEQGYEKSELMDAGLAVAGKNGGLYDKFRNRLMLPVIDTRGDVIGFTSRVMDDADIPKYLNTPETALFKKRSVLYGLHLAKKSNARSLLLVEGNLDVITLHQAGFDNAVATMGTALTGDHAKLMSRYTQEIILCYDNDTAGVEATERAMAVLRSTDFDVKVLQLPRRRNEDGQLVKQDPDDFLKHQGAAAFRALLDGSENQTAYRLGAIRDKHTRDDDESRAAFLQEAAEMIAGLESAVEREIYATRAAREADISTDAMLREVEARRKQSLRRSRRQEERKSMTPAARLQPKVRALRYQNVRAAQAEGGVLRLAFTDPALLGKMDALSPESFSVPLFGQVFSVLQTRWRAGKRTGAAHFEERLSPDELDHLTAVLGEEDRIANADAALRDYIEIINTESEKGPLSSDADVLKIRETLRKKKMGGSGT